VIQGRFRLWLEQLHSELWESATLVNTVKLSSLSSAGLQKWLTALGEMTVYVTGLVTECWFNTVLAVEWLYPLRDVLFLLYPHVSEPPCHTAVEISPLSRLSPPHHCLCDIKVESSIVLK